MPFIEELTEATGRVAETAGQAVVRIGRDGGRGAGTVIAPGLVLTSAHNLRGPEVTVTFADGRAVTGTAKGVDGDGDLAVIAVDTGTAAPIGWEASAEGPKLGAAVFALALPAAGSGPRLTFGLVTGVGHSFRGPRGRLIADGVEHSAPLGRGSSGGPLVDPAGRLVAVNTHRPGDGLYLAVPATEALKARVDALAAGETPARRHLGVALTPGHVARRLRARSACRPVTGCWCETSARTPRPRLRGWREATSLWPPAVSRSPPSTPCSPPSTGSGKTATWPSRSCEAPTRCRSRSISALDRGDQPGSACAPGVGPAAHPGVGPAFPPNGVPSPGREGSGPDRLDGPRWSRPPRTPPPEQVRRSPGPNDAARQGGLAPPIAPTCFRL